MRKPAMSIMLRTMAVGTVMAMGMGSRAQTPADSLETPLVPSFSLGTGMMGFYGDVGFQGKDYSPLVSRIGFQLRAFTPINNWLEVGLFALHGRLSEYEHRADRRLNFESRITTGGVEFVYNFHQLLKPGHVVEPWVSIGFESIEFLSKTDLRDAQGRLYHYWSDGSIRDIDEYAPNAADAVEIFQDYSFESDLRETNADGFGKYSEQTWGIPVGVGAKMRLGHGFDARVGATMHFTATDYIDGVTDMSLGTRKGDARNDRFLFTSFSIGYGITPKSAKKTKFKPTLSPEEMDILALNEDQDGDGVPDWIDRCPHTPPGTPVDEFGCPHDGDGDGVPDYRDDELFTPPGNAVDARGVSLSDDDLLRAYLNYLDSGNVTFIYSTVESFGPKGKPVVKRPPIRSARTFVVKVGEQVEGISEEMIQRILSLPDVRTMERGDTTFYVVGNYDDLPDAIKRELQLRDQGFAGTVMVDEDGQLLDLSEGHITPREEEAIDEFAPPLSPDAMPPGEVVVRVQLGAFRQPLAENIFRNIPDLVTLKGDDGLTRYYTGSFADVNQAARHKVNVLLEGFDDAFLVAFRDGRRVSITEAGAQLTGPETLDNVPVGSINTSNLVFRVQVGTFAGNVPMETMSRYVELGGIKAVPGPNVVRYMYGEFHDRASAEKARGELQAKGFNDAFVIGDLGGRIILAEDAERLLQDNR